MNTGSPQELIGALPDLDITQFNHWEDYLYNLQVGQTKLPGIEGDRASEIGHYGFSIARHLIQGLREGQQDLNGQPFTICVDQVSDEQVITEATSNDRQKFFLKAFLMQANRRGFSHLQERASAYITASITLGEAVIGLDQAHIIELLSKALEAETTLHVMDKQVLRACIEQVIPTEIKTLTAYLKYSQTQMTNEEQRVMVTAQKEAPVLGSEPIKIGNEEFSFVGSGDPPIQLTPEDIGLLIPMVKAIKKSRLDMIEQAKEFAFQYLKIDREKFENRRPPEWWINGEDGEGLRSNEVLLYIPYEAKELEDASTPAFIRTLMGEEDFRFEWNKIVISKEQPNLIVGIYKLNN